MLWAVGLALFLTFAVSASAQQSSDSSAHQNDANQQLLRRISELEAKVKQLEEKQGAATPVTAATPEQVSVAEAPRQNQVAERLQLRLFGDMGYRASDEKGDTNSFDIGSLDMFMTARLSHQESLLGELLFISTNTNDINLDVERLMLQYHANDYLNLGIGRYHSAIGLLQHGLPPGAMVPDRHWAAFHVRVR
jgi:hypothetical protein